MLTWTLSVCCGSEENAAAVLAQIVAFGERVTVLSKVVPLLIERDYHQGEHWVNVYPRTADGAEDLWPQGRPNSAMQALEMNAMGQLLSDRLHHAGEVSYLFAILGAAAFGWKTSKEVAELLKEYDLSLPLGLVVSDELWKRGGSPVLFREFSPGYRFDGWAEEKFRAE